MGWKLLTIRNNDPWSLAFQALRRYRFMYSKDGSCMLVSFSNPISAILSAERDFSPFKNYKDKLFWQERSTLCRGYHVLNRRPGFWEGKEPDARHFKSYSLIISRTIIAQLSCRFEIEHIISRIWHQKVYWIVLSAVLFTQIRSTFSSNRRRKIPSVKWWG